MKVEKSHTSALHGYYLSQANTAYSILMWQLEAVIIEVSVVQVQRLRTIPQWVHEVKYLVPMKVTYTVTQIAYAMVLQIQVPSC